MSVERMSAEVTGVLKHAESLFAAPGSFDPDSAVGASQAAADASRGIASAVGELSGSAATTHAQSLDAATQQLESVASADDSLVQHVVAAAAGQRDGLARAAQLCADAEEMPAALEPWAELPAAELAALHALRAQVADAKDLIASQSAEAERLAGELRELGFGA